MSIDRLSSRKVPTVFSPSFPPCSLPTVKRSHIKTSSSFSESNVFYETHCSTINRIEKLDSGSQTRKTWQVSDLKENASEFDTVIVTIPTPQLLNLKGSIQDFLESKRSSLEAVQYSSRYALALYFDHEAKINVPWACKYVVGNPCVRYISVDSRKRFGKDPEDVGPSLIVHTSVPFGIKHLEMDLNDVKDIILSHVKQELPDLPEPVNSRCIRWRYSQVSRGVEDSPGCAVLCDTPLLIACGDAFTHTNFDGCIESALSVVDAFSKITPESSL
ncbi:hypothetical protein ACROYT_G032279 [Oculina patagonica]